MGDVGEGMGFEADEEERCRKGEREERVRERPRRFSVVVSDVHEAADVDRRGDADEVVGGAGMWGSGMFISVYRGPSYWRQKGSNVVAVMSEVVGIGAS